MYNIRLFGIVTVNPPPPPYNEYILKKTAKQRTEQFYQKWG
jgi:hypothetical protein